MLDEQERGLLGRLSVFAGGLTNTGGGVNDYGPDFSPDGTKVTYQSYGIQNSNSEGDYEIYLMNALDGSAKKNLTNNNALDFYAEWGR